VDFAKRPAIPDLNEAFAIQGGRTASASASIFDVDAGDSCALAPPSTVRQMGKPAVAKSCVGVGKRPGYSPLDWM